MNNAPATAATTGTIHGATSSIDGSLRTSSARAETGFEAVGDDDAIEDEAVVGMSV